jgi:hypothetical protein
MFIRWRMASPGENKPTRERLGTACVLLHYLTKGFVFNSSSIELIVNQPHWWIGLKALVGRLEAKQ